MTTPAGLYRNPNAAYRSDEEPTPDPYRMLPAGKATNGRMTGMTMLTLDTSFFDLPIVLEAGPMAALCYLGAYLWTVKHGTKGMIPTGAIGSLCDWGQLDSVGTMAADRCVAVGLMERVSGGYRLLDYKGGQG
jgi:hypothetical protein